uniref:Peptidase aspartic putative domain-containing protein n=1 Tax=Timema genevievae TaxID=629358 RepID=A0A7R9JUD3_TIMGE|nr:unnamed protein product [Timema genevievae]
MRQPGALEHAILRLRLRELLSLLARVMITAFQVCTQQWEAPVYSIGQGWAAVEVPIDLLIGARLLFDLSCERRITAPCLATIHETVLGWILSGKIQGHCGDEQPTIRVSMFLCYDSGLETQLQQFWQIEELNGPIRVKMPGLIHVNEFVEETREDYNSPTTSTFVSRMPQCRQTITSLEEVGNACEIEDFENEDGGENGKEQKETNIQENIQETEDG